VPTAARSAWARRAKSAPLPTLRSLLLAGHEANLRNIRPLLTEDGTFEHMSKSGIAEIMLAVRVVVGRENVEAPHKRKRLIRENDA
jgi:hypothetical protein